MCVHHDNGYAAVLTLDSVNNVYIILNTASLSNGTPKNHVTVFI